MSISPLPVHMGCYGMHQEAVSACRGYSKSSSNYDARLASVKASMAAVQQPASAPVTSGQASGAAAARPSGGSPSPGHQALQVTLQPLSAGQSVPHTSSGGAHAPSSSAPASLSVYRAHSRHAPGATLQSIDFTSIAESSVGGGGVPRPYGKFTACRAGDGNATWQRMPPQPGSWQAKALPVAVTVLEDGEAGPGSPAGPGTWSAPLSSPQRHASPKRQGPMDQSQPHHPHQQHQHQHHHQQYQHHPHNGASPKRGRTFPHLRGPVPATYPGPASSRNKPMASSLYGVPQSSPYGGAWNGSAGGQGVLTSGVPGTAPAAAGGGTLALPNENSYYRRPGSSMHRSLVPLPPPEPHNPAAWFALPSATFLTDMPSVPEHLRMDNGYSVSREFLLSGLHQKKPRAQQQQQQQYASPSSPMSPQQPLDAGDHSPQHQQHQHQHQHQHPDLRVGDKQELWDALEKGGQGQNPAAYAPLVGPMGLRGVYVPVDNRSLMAQQGQGPLRGMGTSEQPPLEQESWVGQELGEEEALLVGGAAGSGNGRTGAILPPEMVLPRRNMPSGW